MRTRSACVRPHVPMLYVSTGITNDAYSRRRSCRLMCARRNHTVDSLRKATLASCLRLATSSASPSSDPSFRVRHSSSNIRLILVLFRIHMVVRCAQCRYGRDVLIKSVSYSTSSGKAASSESNERFIMCLIFVMIMNVICCMISNAVLLHNNVSYSHPFEYCNVTSTTCNAKLAKINSLSGIMISGLHSYQTLVRNFCEELVNICFAFKIFRQTTVLKNGMSRMQRQCYCFSNICCSFCRMLIFLSIAFCVIDLISMLIR